MPRLLETVQRQTVKDIEVIVIEGVSPQGKAINQGAARAQGEVLLILDDDSWLVDDRVFARLLETLDQDPAIGMAGASIILPPEASAFQRRAAAQFPRFNTPVVGEITDSDLACHGCCAIPRRIFDEVGGERESIVRGLDPDLRVRLRERGYRVVLAPNAAIYHPLPDGWRRLSRIFFRNGRGSAYSQRHHPETVYDTSETLDDDGFQPRRSFAYRVARFPLRLVRAIATGEFIRFVGYGAYAAGYGWEWLVGPRRNGS